MITLKSKNIIVTGASGGIGNSIVEKLNQAEANILATGTRKENLMSLKINIKILKYLSLIYLKLIKSRNLLKKQLMNLEEI